MNISQEVEQELKEDGDMIDGALDQSPDMVTLVAKVTHDEMDQLRELSRRYGSPYFAEVIRLAITDALAHFACVPVEDQTDEDEEGQADEVEEEGQTDEVEETPDVVEPEKNASPYNSRKIAVLQSLTGQGKDFALAYLKAPRTTSPIKGDHSTGGQQVKSLIDTTVIPPVGGWSRDPAKRNAQTRKARRDLLAYLQTADLEKTPLDIESEQETVIPPEKSAAERLTERRAARTRHIGRKSEGE